jgi:type I restriction enzyme S subunit
MKPGYIQTEMGVIPEDWEVAKVGDISRVIRGASPRPKGDNRFYGGPVPRLMVEDVTRDGKIVFPQVDSLTEEGAKLSRPCKKGTLTIVCSGTVGIPSFLGVDACIHDGFLALVAIRKSVSSDYLYYQFDRLRLNFESSATHGGVFTNLTTAGVREFIVPLPPTETEQKAIAAALSDVDALLAGLERLIAKKRDLKQAAMQQLLTGQTRLPGFHGAWEVKRLGEVADILKGNALSKSQIKNSGSNLCILYGELFTTYGRVITNIFSRTDSNEGCLSLHGDILLPGSTTTTGIDLAIASALLIDNVALGGDIIIVRCRGVVYDSIFLANYLTYVKKLEIAELTQGITIHHLYGKTLKPLMIELPPLPEQIAIAEALSDMDAELAAMEQRRDKTRALKQAMMQELLTGRTRLL